MKLDAMKRQGARTDLTSSPVAMKSKSKQTLEIVGEANGDSKDQVRRYVRLTELIPQVLDLVDEGQLAMRPAVELSYLSQEQQQSLLYAIESEDGAPSFAQAVQMRKVSEEGQLNEDTIISIMQEAKPTQVKHLKLSREKIHHFFPANTSVQMIEKTIINALDLWYKDKGMI
jgi:ParB family chromosome partitioning protein